jgi:hypothetical protein
MKLNAVQKTAKPEVPQATRPAGKTIRITCQGSAFAKLGDLVPLQGELKSLDAARYKKLKRALLDHGFSFPFFVWPDGGKLKLLDGHQRDRVLRGMKAQGYHIPALPICTIEAKDEAEARKKILLLTSQYGAMTDDTLLQFLKESELDLDEVVDTVDLPQVDVDKLLAKMIDDLQAPAAVNNQPRYQVIVDCENQLDQIQIQQKIQSIGMTCRTVTV